MQNSEYLSSLDHWIFKCCILILRVLFLKYEPIYNYAEIRNRIQKLLMPYQKYKSCLSFYASRKLHLSWKKNESSIITIWDMICFNQYLQIYVHMTYLWPFGFDAAINVLFEIKEKYYSVCKLRFQFQPIFMG